MPTRLATNLALDAATQARLRRLADARSRPPGRLVREAIEEYLDREEGRADFRKNAFTAWAEFQATGMHVTEAEADAWLARLEAGEDAEPPQPHS
jgi:predicted transcriptional regulator